MLRLAITKKGNSSQEERIFDNSHEGGAEIVAIGRADTNDVVLEDSGGMVSRYHAAIVRLSGPEEGWFIRDLSSRNATWIGGIPVCRKRLRHGEVVEIGEYRLSCCFQEGPGATAAEEDIPLVVDEDKSRSLDGERGSSSRPTRAPGLHEGMIPGDPRGEAIEELLRKAQVTAEAGSLFREFIGPILRAVDADRGFIALFRPGSSACQCIARQMGEREKIKIADASFRETLRKGLRLEEGRILLVPLWAGKEAVGFFCANRKPPKPVFSLEDGDFLEQLGSRVMALRKPEAGTPTAVAQEAAAVAEEELEWPPGLVGNSEGMRLVCQQLEEALDKDAAVLLTGETGTGKELVATALHQRSSRAAGPLVAVNCSTISKDVPELVLFGYPARSALEHSDEEGSPGLIEQAHKGTLFLDEIQSMGLKVQPQLLRVMEEKRVRRIGGREAVPVDVRFIGATNEDLEMKVAYKEFRADLYERFARRIFLPPLRAHREDIPLLAHYFIDYFARHQGKKTRWISRAALQRLMEHDWPGNVRELWRCIQNTVADDREVIFSWDLFKDRPARSFAEQEEAAPAPAQGAAPRTPRPMIEIEKAAIQETLEYTRGNKSQAAKLLGWTWQTLDNKVKRYGLST